MLVRSPLSYLLWSEFMCPSRYTQPRQGREGSLLRDHLFSGSNKWLSTLVEWQCETPLGGTSSAPPDKFCRLGAQSQPQADQRAASWAGWASSGSLPPIAAQRLPIQTMSAKGATDFSYAFISLFLLVQCG